MEVGEADVLALVLVEPLVEVVVGGIDSEIGDVVGRTDSGLGVVCSMGVFVFRELHK